MGIPKYPETKVNNYFNVAKPGNTLLPSAT